MTDKIKVYAVTWNVGESIPPDDLGPLFGLDSKELPDLYFVGLQEVNINTKPRWKAEILSTLSPRGYQRMDTDEVHQERTHFEVYMKFESVRDVVLVETKTFLFQNHGQESVSVTMQIHGTEINFLNSMLSSDYQQKQQHLTSISCVLPLDNSLTIWIGDLGFGLENPRNQRLNWPLSLQECNELARYNQLMALPSRGTGILATFQEMALKFPPSSKFLIGSLDYDRRDEMRWTDRILWKLSAEQRNLKVRPLYYGSICYHRICHHKPVAALFDVMVQRDFSSITVRIERPSSWVQGQNLKVKYIVPTGFPIEDEDFIAIRRGTNVCCTVGTLPKRGQCDQEGANTFSVIFEEKFLRELMGGRYTICYFSEHFCGEVGCCKFELLENDLVWPGGNRLKLDGEFD